MYIEELLIYILIFIVVVWWIWFKWSNWRLKRKYKPEDDKSRKGGVFGKGIGTEERAIDETEPRVTAPVNDSVGLGEPERREFLPPPVVDDVGKDSISPRKDSRSLNKLLRRTRKK